MPYDAGSDYCPLLMEGSQYMAPIIQFHSRPMLRLADSSARLSTLASGGNALDELPGFIASVVD